MKRLMAAIFLTVLILVFCACSQAVTKRSMQSVQNAMQEIEAALTAGEVEIALQKSETFLYEWENTHGQLCVFLQHTHLEPLERIISLLPYYLQQNTTLAAAEARTAHSMAGHILKSEAVTAGNIL